MLVGGGVLYKRATLFRFAVFSRHEKTLAYLFDAFVGDGLHLITSTSANRAKKQTLLFYSLRCVPLSETKHTPCFVGGQERLWQF